MHLLGTPDDPTAFTDFDASNPVEISHLGRTYYAYRLTANSVLGGDDTRRRVPRLVYVGRPGDLPIPFGMCERNDDRLTVAGRLHAFLAEQERMSRNQIPT